MKLRLGLRLHAHKNSREIAMRRTKNSSSKMILVVDDDPEILDSIQLAASADGFTVRVAQDQAEAFEIIALQPPAIILLDYYGLGENADKFVERIRGLRINVPIVLMTGAKDAQGKARQCGLKDCLTKPFNLPALKKMLAKYKINRSKPAEKIEFALFS
jgi:two-component system, chemotaxis family, chemotaxis protein CheY